ncbi:MAG: glycine cleavage system aminomethyltransferase GcvT [Acidobacteria bacterium]|nr:glycine cleavage system aminomethyltransferase GcvT [Acidobacteriota bacterium]
MKTTPLCAEHISLGARMVGFSGWNMPVQYSGLMDEHHAVRQSVGLFDVSHMGEFRVKGPDALRFLESITTNHVAKLTDGRIHYTLLTYPEGTIVDDLLIYRFDENNYWMVVNAGNIDKDWSWVTQHATGFDIELTNESDRTAQIAIQGPLAETVLQQLVDRDLSEVPYYHFYEGPVNAVAAVVSRTGYTGEDGFEVYCASEHAVSLWRAMLDKGAEHGIKPAGLGARDTLRLESRMALYGNDIDQTTNALEAGLGWVVKFKKDDPFVGRDALLRIKEEGLVRKLVCFEVTGRGIARHGYPIANASGETIGVVTSGSHSPTLDKAIGMGYVDVAYSEPNTEIAIQVRQKAVAACVVKGPFYQRQK